MISVCICTHNPRPAILKQALEALLAQDAQATPWELLVVDNGSTTPLTPGGLFGAGFPVPARVVREDQLGLSHARMRAFRETQGEILLFVDDDNFLEPAYVSSVSRFFQAHPRAGALGGRGRAISDRPLPAWFDLVADQLAVRNLGDREIQLVGDAPCGAGMAVRRPAFQKAVSWPQLLVDRQGARLSSGGDTELCLRIAHSGWELWYDPALRLEHHLEERRLEKEYLEKLNEGFGLARPFIDLYASPELPWRRLNSLRRSRYEARQSRLLAREAIEEKDERRQLDLRLRSAFSSGLSRGLRLLAFGPAVWREVARRFPQRRVKR